MRRICTIIDKSDGGKPKVFLDGVNAKSLKPQLSMNVYAPHGVIYLNGERSYDIEWWDAGKMKTYVPPQSPEVDLVYDAYEKKNWNLLNPISLDRNSKQSLMQHIRLLEEEIENSQGKRIYQLWNYWIKSKNVYVRNLNELFSSIQQIESSKNSLFLENDDELFEIFEQRFQNYLAHSSGFFEYSRNISAQIDDPKVRNEILRLFSSVIKEPIVAFVRLLRNYTAHHSIIKYTRKITINSKSSDGVKLQIHVSDFLEANKKENIALTKFIQESPEQIDVGNLLKSYDLLVRNYYEKIISKISAWHEKDFDSLETLTQKLSALQTDLNRLLENEPVREIRLSQPISWEK